MVVKTNSEIFAQNYEAATGEDCEIHSLEKKVKKVSESKKEEEKEESKAKAKAKSKSKK